MAEVAKMPPHYLFVEKVNPVVKEQMEGHAEADSCSLFHIYIWFDKMLSFIYLTQLEISRFQYCWKLNVFTWYVMVFNFKQILHKIIGRKQ